MMRERRHLVALAFRRVSWLLPTAALALFLAVCCADISIADERLLDLLFRMSAGRATTSDVVVVAIDDDSLSRLGMRWPWSRAIYADLLDRLADSGASVCGFDLLFSETDDSDLYLADVFRRASVPVVLASKLEQGQRDGYRSTRYIRPVPILTESAAACGYANLPIDADGVVRHVPSWSEFSGVEVQSFWSSVVSTYDSLRDVNYSGAARINYVGGPGSIQTVSFYQVLEGLVPPERLRGKVVLVGLTSEDLGDRHLTPYSSEGTMAGVEVHANIVDMVLSGADFEEVSGIARVLIHTLFGIVVAAGVAFSPGPVGPLVSIVLTLGYMLVSVVLVEKAIIVPPLPAVLMCVFMPSAVYGFRYLAAERARRRIHRIFAKYVPANLTCEMLESNERSLSPQMFDASVFFCDLRGFTSLASRLSPEQTVTFLNSFFEQAADSVSLHGGLIMKFLGDGFMAVFGVDSTDQNHAEHAVEAAIEIVESVKSVRLDRTGRSETVRVGIGVHSGEIFISDVGSRLWLDRTAVGDTVNTASRLEGLTRQLGADILISARTHARLGSQVQGRFDPIHGVEVRGLSTMTVFALARKGGGSGGECEPQDGATQGDVSLQPLG